MTHLYIIGTPIGNLEDVSIRAFRILKEADFVLCEDTRVTKRLLDYYNIKTPTISYHQHSRLSKVQRILKLLEEGNNLALVSDSGTPGISDPGGKLVDRIRREKGEEVKIECIPGPSAVTAALSISGMPADKFLFLGFPPHKKGRQKFLHRIMAEEYPVVVYESKHRIMKFLNELKTGLEENGEEVKTKQKETTLVAVCRELSKIYETVYRGGIEEVVDQMDTEKKGNKEDQKGEFVIIIK